MKFYYKEEATRLMNCLGSEGRPFLFIINYLQDKVFMEEAASIDPAELLYDLNGFTNVSNEDHSNAIVHPILWEPEPVHYAIYETSFRKVAAHIRAGNSYLVNLTCSTPVCTNLSSTDIFYRAKARYRLYLKDQFVVFSPEIFVRITDNRIYSYPMKGTIDASLHDAANRILCDPKEEAEHATIVDLIRNDLSQVSDQVTVSRYRYIDKLQTNKGPLLQVSSEINGKLPEQWQRNLGDLVFKLLPAGSVTGAPKKKTLQIIVEAETYQRGFYTGVMGYFDGHNLDSSVMIRYMEPQADGRFLFKSGGGITSLSNPESEYNEMIQKVYVPIY